MGADCFITYGADTDPAEAFRDCVEDAQYEYGHAGYTGTIAEKENFGYQIISEEPLSMDEAKALADKLVRTRDPRISDKAGPTGAVAVSGGERQVRVSIPAAPGGWRSAEEAATAAITLADGEKIVSVTGAYEIDQSTRRFISGDLTIITEGAPQHTGWLFVGWSPI